MGILENLRIWVRIFITQNDETQSGNLVILISRLITHALHMQ